MIHPKTYINGFRIKLLSEQYMVVKGKMGHSEVSFNARIQNRILKEKSEMLYCPLFKSHIKCF
jgi:hypothetical protein